MSGIIGEAGSKSGIIGDIMPWAYLYRTGDQTFATGDYAQMVWQGIKGHGSISANDGWNIPKTGWYRVSIVVNAHTTSDNITDRRVKLSQGTSADAEETWKWSAYTSQGGSPCPNRHVDVTGNAIIYLNAGKVLFAWAYMVGSGTVVAFASDANVNSTGMHVNFLGTTNYH